MITRRYRDTSPRMAAAQILSDIVCLGASDWWDGSHEEFAAMRAILRPFNVVCVDVVSHEWRVRS